MELAAAEEGVSRKVVVGGADVGISGREGGKGALVNVSQLLSIYALLVFKTCFILRSILGWEGTWWIVVDQDMLLCAGL